MSYRKLLGAAALTLAAGFAQAAYPERELTGVIMWGAGGGTDNFARAITPIAEKYYSKIMTGEAGIVDYSKLEAEIIEKVNAALTKQVDDKYIDELTATYNRNIEAKYNSEEYKASIRDQARDIAIKSYITTPFKKRSTYS